MMKIIAGLGNPGLRYRRTRHNLGFMVVEALAKKYKIRLNKKGFNGRYGTGRISGEEILLFEPLTYMNLSGVAVKSVIKSKMEEKKDLLVILDDFNLPLGSIRIRSKGSDGGHNGLKSISEHIGDNFSRLRIGIGKELFFEDTVSFVLSPFLKKERPVLEEAVSKAVEIVETWLKMDILETMNRYN